MKNIYTTVVLMLSILGSTNCSSKVAKKAELVLQNNNIKVTWNADGGKLLLGSIADIKTDNVLMVNRSPFSFEVDGKTRKASEMKLLSPLELMPFVANPKAARRSDQLPGKIISATLRDEKTGVMANWQARLNEGSSYIRQIVTLSSQKPAKLTKVTLIDLTAPNATVVGEVSGSPVVTDNMFFAFESPLSTTQIPNDLEWSPDDFPVDASRRNLEYDITNLIKTPGKYTVSFKYQKGALRLDMHQVSLFEDKREIAVDEHDGFTGHRQENYEYQLNVAKYNKKAKYTLVVNAHLDGGNNSWGSISIIHNGQTLRSKGAKNINCSYNRNTTLSPNNSYTCSAVYGVYPEGQLRRSFLNYIERERAHPYRQYLHYNTWCDLNINRPKNRMTDAEAQNAIEQIGTELVEKRGVKMGGFVMDDGWDSHVNVWDFHDKFPDGFTNIGNIAKRFDAGIGLWMSPWGGYGAEKVARIKHGTAAGLETNRNGFSMAGKNYQAHFRSTALRMISKYGVNYFKFDGMGGGNFTSGAQAEFSDDIAAILNIVTDIRRAKRDVWINATVGTWPSPYWTFHADSIWRQGEDVEFFGVGSWREKWITYRDKITYERIVKRGPLFPLNSLMFHGLVIASRANPRKMEMDRLSVRNEIRIAFACGTGLQELYITPSMLTPEMWDDLAESAKWSRRNIDVLADTHWVGGDPGKLEPYGWASWNARKGIISYRNPSDKAQNVTFDIAKVFELPDGAPHNYLLKTPYPDQRIKQKIAIAGELITLTLEPFELLCFDAFPNK